MDKPCTPLPEHMVAYIRQHLNDRPRTAVAEHLGISMSTLYRYVRKFKGDRLMHRARRNPEWVDIVRQHYADMSGHEIERKFGITLNRANRIAADLGLKHSPETIERLQREQRERLKMNNSKGEAKRAKTWKRRFRMDELRVMQGEPQKTKFRIQVRPVRTYKAMYNLCRNYGYVMTDEHPFTLYYGEHTRRRPLDKGCGTERYYSDIYHIQFKPLDYEQEETDHEQWQAAAR